MFSIFNLSFKSNILENLDKLFAVCESVLRGKDCFNNINLLTLTFALSIGSTSSLVQYRDL